MKHTESTLEEVRDDKDLFGHPRAIGTLALGNFCNSAAWGAFYALMIYYLYAPLFQGAGVLPG